MWSGSGRCFAEGGNESPQENTGHRPRRFKGEPRLGNSLIPCRATPILQSLSTTQAAPVSAFQAMIRNHNLMLHCHTVSTLISWGELNDLFVGLRLWLPHRTLCSGRVATLGSNHLCRLITEACNMLIRRMLWTCFSCSNFTASVEVPPPILA